MTSTSFIVKEHQLCHELDRIDQKSNLPGFPSITIENIDGLSTFLYADLVSGELESAAPSLWIMTTQSSANVKALHRQLIVGRNIQVTEEPRLHLVWSHDRIFVKPIPRYLLSHAFWTKVLAKDLASTLGSKGIIMRSALGLIRTYRHLITHESDFAIAQRDELRLVPSNVTWKQYCDFMSDFSSIRDSDVSQRYYYGELRLSRLNLFACILFRKAYFERMHWQSSDYFARLFGPILFGFAIITTILNAMQVALAVEQVDSRQWASFWSVCRWFAIACMIAVAAVGSILLCIWIYLISDEWAFALRDLWRKRHVRPRSMKKGHSVV